MTLHQTANPRRITLAHLDDAAGMWTPERPEHSLDLPERTANPRRTVLMELPPETLAVADR